MYFSRVRIATSNLARITLLKVLQGDAYAIHQLVWKLFPNFPEKIRDFLFRQEFEKEQISFSETRRGMPIFYLVSPVPPKPVEGLLDVETKIYAPKLETGTKLGFEVRVNPVVARKISDRKHSPKHDVLMDAKFHAKKEGLTDKSAIEKRMQEAVIEWLSKKSEKAGFQFDRSIIEVTGYRQNFLKYARKSPIRFSSVDFSGVLTVKEPIVFTNALFSGFGHSRAFGCGMMMIRRLP